MPMLRVPRRMLRAFAIGLCLTAQPLLVSTTSAQQPKPNILFILADNIGYGDIGAYGGGELRGAPTPRIDRLAAESLRLTQFLVEPGCTPSRAALMTARYSIRSGLSLVAVEGTAISLPAREITMAEMLERLRNMVMSAGELNLRLFFERARSRRELVLAFLSVLELVRTTEVRLFQRETFGDIVARASN